MPSIIFTNTDGLLTRLELQAPSNETLCVCFDGPGPRLHNWEGTASAPHPQAPTLMRIDGQGKPAWALVGPVNSATVSGQPILLGIRVLRHRDLVRYNDGNLPSFYFSDESKPGIAQFDGEAEQVRCPRCQQFVNPGDHIVRCPGCATVYHEIHDHRPCWSCASRCMVDDHPTTLDAEYHFAPVEI